MDEENTEEARWRLSRYAPPEQPREDKPEHIAICLNDLARQLRQISKYLEGAAHDATRIALRFKGK